MLLSYTAKAQVAQSVVDTNFVNPSSIVKLSAQSVDKITVAYNWYANGILKKTKDSLNSFTDTINNDTRITVVPISDSGAVGDTFATIFSVHIPDRIEWASPSGSVCLDNDTTFKNAQIGINLKGYKLGVGEKYRIIYSIENQGSGVLISMDTLVLDTISAIINIDTKKLGLGSFSIKIQHLFYGPDEGNHIDLSTVLSNPVNIRKIIEFKLKVAIKPEIIDIKY
jgi:hypothetical protein